MLATRYFCKHRQPTAVSGVLLKKSPAATSFLNLNPIVQGCQVPTGWHPCQA